MRRKKQTSLMSMSAIHGCTAPVPAVTGVEQASKTRMAEAWIREADADAEGVDEVEEAEGRTAG